MTKVLVLMWLADIAGSISTVGILSLIAVIAGLLWAAIWAGVEEDFSLFSKMTRYLGWFAVPIVVALIAPSSSTVRLIAATQAVEVAANTPLGAKAVEAVEAVLTKIKNDALK